MPSNCLSKQGVIDVIQGTDSWGRWKHLRDISSRLGVACSIKDIRALRMIILSIFLRFFPLLFFFLKRKRSVVGVGVACIA